MPNSIAEKYLKGSRSAKAIYGIILITATLIGFQFHESEPLTIAASVFIAGLVIGLAEAYSELLGEKIRREKKLNKLERREIIDHAFVVSSIAVYPVAVFLVSALGLYSVDVAFDISFGLSIIGLGLFGFSASRAAGEPRGVSYRKAILISLIGAAVILIEYTYAH